jgi:hypothetical protein
MIRNVWKCKAQPPGADKFAKLHFSDVVSAGKGDATMMTAKRRCWLRNAAAPVGVTFVACMVVAATAPAQSVPAVRRAIETAIAVEDQARITARNLPGQVWSIASA